MKLKLTPDGHAVVKNGMPVYVHGDGREEPFDGPAAMKLAIGKHFQASPVMAGLKIPADVAAAFFGDSFRIEGGKLKAVDANGTQIYSIKRHGEAADFDEAFGELVNRYQRKDQIVREGGAAPAAATPSVTGKPGAGVSVTRAQFDSMPQMTRGRFLKEGGRIDEAGTGTAPAKPRAVEQRAGAAVTRAQFDVMPQADRFVFFNAGGTVSD